MSKSRVIISVVATCCVLTAIIVPCVILLPKDADSIQDRSKYNFDDLYSNKYSYDYLYPNWDESSESATDYVTMSEDGSIVRKELLEGSSEVIFPGKLFTENDYQGYSLSKTSEYIVYWKNYKKVWRHSYLADFYVYQKENEVELGESVGIPKQAHYCEWSPTGNKLAIVYQWNLWYIDFDVATPTLKQITFDGEENKIYNAIPDWMYEEEGIGSNNVLYWSPDATRIAFLRTDDTKTRLIEFSTYPDGKQYPETVKIAYSKSGIEIPDVSLLMYDIKTDAIYDFAAPYTPATDPDGYYFQRFVWMPNSYGLATWTNRVQDESIATKCSVNVDTNDIVTTSCGNTGIGMKENNKGKGWVGNFNPFDVKVKTQSSSPGSYYTIYSRENDDDVSEGYWQIADVTAANKDDATRDWLTKTSYDIVELVHYDHDNNWLYFLAASPEPRDRQIYKVNPKIFDVKEPECMTCKLMNKYEDRCRWVAAAFNKENNHVVINCRGPMVPMTVRIPIISGEWGDDVVVISNNDLVESIKSVAWPVREFNSFRSRSGYDYTYEIWKPYNFDENKKYPLIVEVYAGPEFQKIQSRWTEAFSQTYLVSNREVIVASVDARGSAYQGYKLMREVYKKLGVFEPEDQTEFANYLINNKDYKIDKDNVAIWGWSYGGQITSHVLGYSDDSNPNPFKCGIAVAPGASYRFYDAMYSERYMTLPRDNEIGYNESEIFKPSNIENIKKNKKWYTLIHGTMDDNVHFQNAAVMEKALVEADIDFDDFFYADQAHSINIGNANKHIYRQIDHRLSTCLGKMNSHYPGNFIG